MREAAYTPSEPVSVCKIVGPRKKGKLGHCLKQSPKSKLVIAP